MADIVKYKFHKTEVDVLPVFNEEFEYSYTDVNENSLISRTITSESNPLSISFKDKNIVKIESLNLTNVEELDIDILDLNVVTNIATLIANCNALKVLRAKANVINELIPHLQTKTNLNSGTIKVSDVSDFVNNNELNIKHWYVDEYRYVDLFVMMGQSNMEGQSEKPEAFEVPTYQSYTYMYNNDTLGQVKHPYGEWINNQITDEDLKQQWLADPSMSGVWWQMEGAEGGQQGQPYAALQPYFAAEYYNQTKVPTVMVQCACGATTVGEWLPGHEKGRYELAVEKITRAVAKAEAEIDRPIRNKYLVWLQGESDGIYKTGTDNYKTRFMQLWTALKTDCGLEKCFMIRVAKFREGKYDDKPIIEAQEQLSQENDDIIIATRITGLLEYPTENPENPTIQDGVTEGYPYVDHYTVAGYKLVGETTAAKIAEYLKIGLRPELEPEPYEGEITSSNERLIVSYKYSGTSSLIPTFDTTFDYRIIDSKDANGYTDRKIISSYVPSRISFQAKSALRELRYIDASKLNTGYGMFYNCTNLTYVNMPYVTYIATMEGMFNGCRKLQRIEGIEKWNTARNSNWGSTFGNCNALTNLDPRNFILTDAHAMGATFRGCYSAPIENFNFSNWCTPNIQYLSGTFDGLKSVIELDVSTFNVSSVGNLQGIFQGCTNLQRVNISNWILTEKHYNWQGDSDKWNPLNVGGMFNNCPALVEVKMENSDRFSIYKVAGVLPTRTADKPSTFIISMDTELDNELASLIESKGWNVSYKKKNREYTVVKYYFNPKIGNILPVFNDGFEYTYTDELGLYDQVLRTIKATSLPTNMYFGTNHVSQDDADSLINVLEIDTSNIEDLSYMFKGCRNIGLIPIGLVTSKATRLTSMFEGCSSLDINYMYQWYTENVVDMSYMFKDCIGMTSIGIEELKISEGTNIEGMFEGCISLRTVRAIPAVFDKVASVLPDRPFDEPGQLTFRTGMDGAGSEADLTCDDELLKHNWLTDRNRHLDLFVMMGQSNMQGQSEIYKEFEVPMYQSCTYLYNKDELAQVKHPFGENIQTLGTIEELGYWQLEGAVGCDTGLPYGSLSPHFAASYYEETHTPTLMVQCARGATTMKDWLPGTTQQRFEIAVEKTQKSIAAVEGIGRTIRGKYLVWLQGESDGAGTGVGTKKSTYKTRFLTFWNAIKEQLGFEKCFIIRVHKFRDGYSYNCFPIIEAQEELALENDDIEMVTRVTGYLQYYDENPEHYTIQHAYQGLQIVSNHDHYTWEGYKLVGDTAGSRVGQYINTGIMPALEEEPWPTKVTASSNNHVATYKFDHTIYANYLPEFNEGYQYRVIDTVEGNITTRKIIGVGLPTLMRFGAYYTYEEIETVQRVATEREKCLLEVTFADTSAVTDAANMFCLNENLTSIPALVIQHCPSLYCMFYKCTNLTYIDGRNFDMSKVTNVENFTWMCTKLQTVDATGWDMSNVNNMYTMFINASALKEIKGIEDWTTTNVKTLISTFYACKSIQSLDLSKWNVENVTTIWWLFNGCLALKSLNLSNWHLTNCIDYTEPFKNCRVLDNVIMKNSDHNTVNKIIATLPAKTEDNPGLLVLDGTVEFNQVNVEDARAKYWVVEYNYEMIDFDKKVVSVNALNKFAKKLNKKIKEKLDELNGQPVENYDDTELRNMISSKADKSELDKLANKEDVLNNQNNISTLQINMSSLQTDKADKSELFSGDYNDLINTPCGDTREYETINCPIIFDGNLTDKVVVRPENTSNIEPMSSSLVKFAVSPSFVKVADVAPIINLPVNEGDAVIDEMVENGNLIVESCVVSDDEKYVSKQGYIYQGYTLETEEANDSYITIYDDNYMPIAAFVYEECITDEFGPKITLTPGIWYLVMFAEDSVYTYTESYSITFVTSGEFKKLDMKFLPDIVGRRLDGQSFDVKKSYHDEEYETITAGENAEAFNSTLNIAIGNNSHVEGRENVARGDHSHAEGMYTYANGGESHAEGYFSVANGNMSHAEGMGTVAEGYISHAEGSHSVANGWGSHAEGEGTIASSNVQHVQGRYNIEDTEDKYAHIVGNGSSYYNDASGTEVENRSNAHTLDWDGNAWFQGNVSIDGTPTNDNDLVTKKYVDDNKFSGDYNDLSNKPNVPSVEGLASETYVQQQVAGIIDTAPETLNTLNELAQALGDDPNFATTIANQIGQKADKSELFSGSYNDLTNKPVIPSIQGLASESYVNQEIDNRLSGLQIVKITQAEYDALATKDPNTLYLIVE